jgi:hypothetical protein
MRDETGTSKGYGFVQYDNFESSDTAIECMSGQFLCNQPIVVQYAFKKDSKGERHGSLAGTPLCVLCPVSCVLCPVSCVLCPVSYVLCPVSCVLCPVSCVLCPVSCVLYALWMKHACTARRWCATPVFAAVALTLTLTLRLCLAVQSACSRRRRSPSQRC